MRTRGLLLRLRRLSSNKFYISSGEFKHTNNKVLINLYVFNRQKNNYLLTLKKQYLKTFLKSTKNLDVKSNINSFYKSKHKLLNLNLINKLKAIDLKGKQATNIINKDKYLFIKSLNTVNNKYNINAFKGISNYTKDFYKKLIEKSLKKIRMYFYYKQLININRSKLNYTYLQFIKKHLENIYNKNVEFNLINLKRFYLNSDIMSESITLKLTKNRRGIRRYLKKLENKVRVRKKSYVGVLPSLGLNNFFSQKKLVLRKQVLKNLKYRHVTGFRLEAKGRLTRRFTASRSMSKVIYKGGLLNKDSSYGGLSSVILKGNLRSNLQYTNLKSKTRIGSFGIKG